MSIPDSGYLIPILPLRWAVLQSINDWGGVKTISVAETSDGFTAEATSKDGTVLKINLTVAKTAGTSTPFKG
jgi:hypothetical protein